MGKQEGKKLTKTKNKHQRRAAQNQREGASPSPSEGGDVPRGIRNIGYWGEGGREKSGLKDVCLFLMGKDLELKKYALSHLICLLTNPQEAVFVGFNIVVE